MEEYARELCEQQRRRDLVQGDLPVASVDRSERWMGYLMSWMSPIPLES